MFRVEIGSEKFDVRFRYRDVVLVHNPSHAGFEYWREIEEGEDLPKNAKIGLCTTCEISKLHPEKEGRERHETISVASVEYHFGKEVKPLTKAEGQKQAFSKAIAAFTDSRDTRRVFWKAFSQAIAAHRWMLDKIEKQAV
jgi:hypothetical protein